MMDQLQDQFEVLEAGSGRIVVDISEHIGYSQRLVAKLVGSRSQNKNETISVSGGFLQNWREILLSRYPPVQDIVQPVVASSRTGLWLVMSYAEQYGIEWDHERIGPKADYLKEHEKVGPVMRGSIGGGLDIYRRSRPSASGLDPRGFTLCTRSRSSSSPPRVQLNRSEPAPL